ncbi:CoA transferase [Mycobacterium malmoense]|uniref:Carnitine dehydratase n=1 Tax=Mycobacterium malmoense TaxID=1780 RepID=A0ABX3SME1_MYCMA|nr:CaiB/BaiF CoA-transferase family protein [Mycobacterium malmoense]ORA78378.1 carnitine dehydratase [Mycobacterium malmoense]QZA16286.1 CoA transferase [Mycobacterium malmoense]UNB93092.1 CoA transferase [Mycobacterium malmoense]
MTGPLHGVRVLVLAGMGPVPFVSMLLADMGAHVVRVVPPRRQGRARPQTAAGCEPADPFNRHVDTVALDLKGPGGSACVLNLVSVGDVFIEGYRPGTAERLGLGPDVLLELNPRLVYARLTGYGQHGPLAKDAGHDINYLAQSGALRGMARGGEAPPPVSLLAGYGGCGTIAAYGIVCALLEARSSGQGQVVDAATVDAVALMSAKLHGLCAAGLYSEESGADFLDEGVPFYGTYQCADGRYLAVGALKPEFYCAFIARLGVDTTAWPGQYDRRQWPHLRERIADALKQRSRNDWAAIYSGTDACVTPVLNSDEAAVAPHNSERGLYEKVDGVLHCAPAPRLSRTPPRPPASPPTALLDFDDLAANWAGCARCPRSAERVAANGRA